MTLWKCKYLIATYNIVLNPSAFKYFNTLITHKQIDTNAEKHTYFKNLLFSHELQSFSFCLKMQMVWMGICLTVWAGCCMEITCL